MTDDQNSQEWPAASSGDEFRLPPDDLAGHQASWPTVVGIISIIYSLFGFLGNGCSSGMVWMSGVTLSLIGIDGTDVEFPLWLKVVQTVMGVFGIGLAILLMVAIGLMRRKAAALGQLKVWAVLAIVSTLIGIGIGFAAIQPNVEFQMAMQDAILDKVRKDGGDPDDPRFADLRKDEETMRRESIRNLAIVGVVPIIYPAIIGFLVTSRTRQEQVESWGDRTPVA